MSNEPVGRFAPSPSGRMHLGNVACALLAWLSVRSQGGEMVLRIEDLDAPRCPRRLARQAIEDGGYDIPCIGIDGITDAVAAVKEGRMIASDFQDAEGQISGAIDAAITVLDGGEVEKEIWIPFQMIRQDNVAEFENKY